MRCHVIPKHLPPIFLDRPFIAFVLLSPNLFGCSGAALQAKHASLKHEATVEGQRKNFIQEVEFAKAVGFTGDLTRDLPLHRFAAKAYIKENEDREEFSGQFKATILVMSVQRDESPQLVCSGC